MAHSPDYDFIGFKFGDTHFKNINVLHVSDGSRYSDNLAPTMQDKTVQVPGGHGTYYFGSYYTQRTFSVQIAYDSLTETDIRTLRQMTNWGIQKLVFDEQPYKTYMAKMNGTPQLKYICFDKGENDRVYKGEGTLQFTCFYPFAICEKKWLKDYYTYNDTPYEGQLREWNYRGEGYFRSLDHMSAIGTSSDQTQHWIYEVVDEGNSIFIINDNFSRFPSHTNYQTVDVNNFPDLTRYEIVSGVSNPIATQNLMTPVKSVRTDNVNEWKDAAQLTPTQGIYDSITGSPTKMFRAYNPGDLPTDFQVYYPKDNVTSDFTVSCANVGTLNISGITTAKSPDTYICVNSKNHLIEGCIKEGQTFVPTGNLYNEYISSGDFFKIPVTGTTHTEVVVTAEAETVTYNYLYL